MRWMVLVLGLVSACALINPTPPPIPDQRVRTPQKTPEDLFNERWTGRQEDDVLVTFGKPVDVLALSSGNHVACFHTETIDSHSESKSAGRGAFGRFGGVDTSNATSVAKTMTLYCDRRFEIDKAGRVVRAVIVGNDCDYLR